ncbi:hypothetical protein Tco_0016676 [Tanacetum coccineum]
MHTTMIPEQVKPQKIQAGVQVSRLEDKDVIFSIESALDVISLSKSSTITPLITLRVVFRRRYICLFDLAACHLVEVSSRSPTFKSFSLGENDSQICFELIFCAVQKLIYFWDNGLVLRMISEAELQVLADLKSILYGLRSEKFGIELCVELKMGKAKLPREAFNKVLRKFPPISSVLHSKMVFESQ